LGLLLSGKCDQMRFFLRSAVPIVDYYRIALHATSQKLAPSCRFHDLGCGDCLWNKEQAKHLVHLTYHLTHTSTRTNIHAYAYTHTYTHIHSHVHKHTRIRIRTNTYTHVHTHAHTNAPLCALAAHAGLG
jgi:hypothetical protein